jgi:diguanylate cyclase (GGDEF)-like protein
MHWYDQFFLTGPIPAKAMFGTYNLSLVLLSYVIASIASYVALDMSAHLRRPTTRSFYLVWLVFGACIMGIGIWSMHFVGMLAFNMDMPMGYNIYWTGASMVVAIIASLVAFLLFSIKKPHLKHYLMSGIALGAAICTMHYTGMEAMEEVAIHYEPGLFFLSVLIAIAASMVALWLSVQSDRGNFIVRTRLKFGSALIMGLAIAGMHYTGMAAAVFTPEKAMHADGINIDLPLLSTSVIVFALSIMTIALTTSTYKYFVDMNLQRKRDFLETILANMAGGVVAFDAHEKVSLFNQTAADIYGPVLQLGAPLNALVENFPLFSPDFSKELDNKERPLYKVAQGNTIEGVEIAIKDYKGRKRSLVVEGRPLYGNEDENLGGVIIFNDISQRKIDEEELLYRATHDMLTGLPNRTLLRDRLDHAISSAQRNHSKTVVIFIDLDNFKVINDALGHSIGDSLLKMVAARFTLLLRSTDTLARLGGDEFVVILPDIEDMDSMPPFLERILENISQPYIVDQHEVNITCSLGFSVYPENGQDTETLLKNADNAMYQAKEGGKNTFRFYTGDMETHIRKRFEIENDMRKALVNEEFFLEYQPKLEIKTNKLVGFEALIRWNHPTHGRIAPNDFIPLAEATGLIIPIGKWVLQMACKQNKLWQNQGLPPLCVSVNLSSRQCTENNLFETVKNTLEETGLEPKYLELELTENLAMSNPREFISLLSKFKELGVKTSIDDFGTGYSSLNYLRQFPVNCLKIDQSFIREMETKEGDLSIVKAIVSLGHSLNMIVIAEGVETKQQLVDLQEQGCDEIQGYYLSRPISSQKMAEFQKNYKRPEG